MKPILIFFIIAGISSTVALNLSAQGAKSKNEKKINTQQETPVKIIKYIPGTWMIDQVLKGKEDITETDTLAKNQTYEFNSEGRYVSYTGSEKIDSGAYRVNEDHGRLYLASAIGGTPTEWNVWFDQSGMMTLQEKNGNTNSDIFRYIYRRTSTTTTSNR